MDYPPELLPHESLTYISCDISGRYLIRHTESREGLWDSETDQILAQHVCSPSAHVTDLSTSLLGTFKTNHIEIQLTTEGKAEYAHYCEPDVSVETPEFETHYTQNSDRGYWHIPIDKIDGATAIFTVGEKLEKFTAICRVIHTPMKWNFWHFSLRWELPDGRLLHDRDEKDAKKYSKRLSGDARALVAQFAKITEITSDDVHKACYTKPQ